MKQSLILFSILLCASCSKKQDAGASEETPAPLQAAAPLAPEESAEQPGALGGPAETKGKSFSGPEALIVAKQGAQGLAKSLKDRLMQSMSEGGPEGALQACAQEAQDLTARAGNRRLRVGRSTLRLRNQDNGKAPQWVQDWLATQGERKAEGLPQLEEVVDGVARVLVPLPIAGLCLTCHGDTNSQSDEMKSLLASRYPEDQAVGYALGDLRGVIWAEVDLVPAP